MKGHGQSTNHHTVALADAQCAASVLCRAEAKRIMAELALPGSRAATLFRLYTEHKPNLVRLVSGYFDSATLFETLGLWQGNTEHGAVIELVSTLDMRARVIELASAIAQENAQTVVLVTWQSSHGFESVSVYGR